MYIQSTFNVHGMYITRPFSRHRIVHKMNSCVLLSSLVFGLSLGTFLSSTWGVSAHTIITENRLNARRLAQELDGSHNPYETLKVCWEHASPLGLYPLRNETREGVRSMQHYNTMRARPFPPLHIMVSSQAISEETALCKWGNCQVRRVLYSFLQRTPSLFRSLVQCTSLRRQNGVAALQRRLVDWTPSLRYAVGGS
jgi:hypothetical protein